MGPSLPRRVLTSRTPVWVVLVVTATAVVSFGVLLIIQAQSDIEIGPAVGAAREVNVRMTLCNADVDRLGLNPRTSELDLEELLLGEGAQRVDVIVERIDCPAAAPG